MTGGRGFVGGNVVAALMAAGHEAVVLDAAPGAHVVGDVRDPTTVETALRGVDAVCHQAAKVGLGVSVEDFPGYASHNDVGTAVLLAAMARASVTTLVLASSMVVYGEGTYACPAHGDVRPGPRRVDDLERGAFEPRCPLCAEAMSPGRVGEDAPLDPRNAYAASKVAQEHYAGAWARAVGGRVIALRYHNVYGPGLPLDTPYAGVAALFRSALRRGDAPRVYEDGAQRRDFVHVRDVANANVAALISLTDAGGNGGLRAYNVASGAPRTVGEMAVALSQALEGPAPVVTGEFRLGDVRHITASAERIARELGWRPTVPFADGMAELATEDGA